MTTAGRLTPTAGTTTFAARPAPAPGQRRLPAAGTPYQLAAGEGPAVWFLGNLVTWKATGEQTHGRLTIAEFVHPAGFGPPLHRHLHEDEIFCILSGTAEFYCKGERLQAAAGDFVLLPAGEPHTFLAGDDAPLRTLQITAPAGFEHFAAAAGTPAGQRRLPGAAQPGPAALGHTATVHGIEILGGGSSGLPPGHLPAGPPGRRTPS